MVAFVPRMMESMSVHLVPECFLEAENMDVNPRTRNTLPSASRNVQSPGCGNSSETKMFRNCHFFPALMAMSFKELDLKP